jgi:UPF0755 protein
MTRLVGTFVILASFLTGWFWMDYRDTVDSPLGNADTAYFEVFKGQGLAAIAESLKQQGLIEKPYWFRLLAYAERSAAKLKYGEYEIPPHTTMRQLLARFVSGKVRQHAVTFIEGWRFQQILAALNQHPALVHRVADRSADEIMNLLGAPGEHAEGRFYPDTYFFTKGTEDLDLLKRAYRKMNAALEQEWQGRADNLPLASSYEALILASIVEKETARADERPLIAGVFNRRLAQGMKLQTDPTVIYGMGEEFKGDIRKEDLARDTPYNTYVRPGLPPTPIAVPGIASIRAALHPDTGASLYFVARGDGSHVFSNSLTEHQQAVEQFQMNRHD